MKLHFLGANRQVTGSRYCLEAGGQHIMIDCGLFQERQFASRNWTESPIPPSQIDALFLTHAHIDHCGLIPKLVADGMRSPIHATRPTVDLAEILLRDSAKIQKEDAAYKRKRHKKEGRTPKHPEVPLYTEHDVDRAIKLFQPAWYQRPVEMNDTFSVTFHDAGHILGSAMLMIRVHENGHHRRVLFSGDIGQWDKPLIRDPSLFEQADYVICESTYGDRLHADGGDIEKQFEVVINRTLARGGNVIIPTFAVERAQELMYYIGRLVHENRIPDTPVFLDSPMAVDVTEVFKNYRDCMDEETWERICAGHPPLHFPGLTMTRSATESRAINEVKQPCIIMATSGMCTSGRVKHHLRRNIHRSASTILFVGYQAAGTLGRQIQERRERVRIHNREYPVKAEVDQIFGFSGHADRRALLHWLENLESPPRQTFLTHGDEEAATSLATELTNRLKWNVAIPEYLETVELE